MISGNRVNGKMRISPTCPMPNAGQGRCLVIDLPPREGRQECGS
jgi:hypothetical protein